MRKETGKTFYFTHFGGILYKNCSTFTVPPFCPQNRLTLSMNRSNAQHGMHTCLFCTTLPFIFNSWTMTVHDARVGFDLCILCFCQSMGEQITPWTSSKIPTPFCRRTTTNPLIRWSATNKQLTEAWGRRLSRIVVFECCHSICHDTFLHNRYRQSLEKNTTNKNAKTHFRTCTESWGRIDRVG